MISYEQRWYRDQVALCTESVRAGGVFMYRKTCGSAMCSTAGKQAVPLGTPEKQAVPRYAARRRTGGMRLRRLQRKGEMF